MPARPPIFRPSYASRAPRRPSAAARGYGTDWRKLRAKAKKLLPYVCADCGLIGDDDSHEGRLHLDHDTPRSRGGSDDLSNLKFRCVRCHSRKTAQADGGFANPIKP